MVMGKDLKVCKRCFTRRHDVESTAASSMRGSQMASAVLYPPSWPSRAPHACGMIGRGDEGSRRDEARFEAGAVNVQVSRHG